jgi:hypothetical protein
MADETCAAAPDTCRCDIRDELSTETVDNVVRNLRRRGPNPRQCWRKLQMLQLWARIS